jgi:hypothetical protein
MALFLDTRGKSTLGIGICARCSEKMSLDDLMPDPNSPGLMCCRDDVDSFDPWRLAPRETENVTLQYARPDTPMFPVGPEHVYVEPLQAVMGAAAPVSVDIVGDGLPAEGIAIAPPAEVIQQPLAWQPQQQYQLGSQVTAVPATGFAAAGLTFSVFLCLVPGMSGATPPAWNWAQGTETQDGQVIWFNLGLFLP